MKQELLDNLDVKTEFSDFIQNFREKLYELFNVRTDVDNLSLQRGLPPYILRQVMDCNPLSTFIPGEYGGRGAKTHEALTMLETASYESLSLSLMMGINGALFLQPLANYGQEEIKEPIFSRFLNEKTLGGLMITEPDYGSDALNMNTSFSQAADSNSYHVKGTKHWAGLTGWADYWLITARERKSDGNLGRDISFFIADSNWGGIEVEEYYNNLGLYMLPYGLNKIDINVPEEYKLQPKSIGIKMMLDVLHRSRLQFPGMAMGFLRRMLDEAYSHCRERLVGGKSLIHYDQVKKRLSKLQASFTICSAMSAYTSEEIPITRDVSSLDVQANSIKATITDLMQQASQSLLQLVGAKGYRLDHIAGRSLVDSRPFQIFEGSNDILYQQITESILKKMKRLKQFNLYKFLSEYSLTENAAGHFKDLLNFTVDSNMAQRKVVELGMVLSRIVSLEFTLNLGAKGFNSELISSAIKSLKADVEEFMASYTNGEPVPVIEDYEDSSMWINYLDYSRINP